MTKADKIFYENIKRLLSDEAVTDESGQVRPHYEDGTPAYTRYITQVVETYDIDKGEFPITTLRPIATKGGIREILAIYQDQRNTRENFEEHEIFWWEDWMKEDGTIGRAYPYNLESHRPKEMKREVVKVKRRIVPKEYGDIVPIRFTELEGSDSKDKKINLKLLLADGEYKVINVYHKKINNKNLKFYQLQSLVNGAIVDVRSDTLLRLKDLSKENPLSRSVFGVGYRGQYENVIGFSKEEIEILKDKWENMFRRCYSDKYEHKDLYKDVFVHREWHSFENFLRTVRYVPQYFLAREQGFKGWELDKDYYGSNCYCSYTCTFLSTQDNSLYAKSEPIDAVVEDKALLYISQKEIENDFGIPQSTVSKILKGQKAQRKDVLLYPHSKEDGYVYRYELSRNQVNELIKNIKNSPMGRRHIMSFWNWANIDKKSLVECAYETIWTVRGEFLDCTLIQRSSDYLVAGHINMMQYVALQMMVAKATGYKPGKFTHFTQNLHIYDRHIEQAHELIRRYEKKYKEYTQNISDAIFEGGMSKDKAIKFCEEEAPKLVFNPKSDNFYEFKLEDFEIFDYEPIRPQLKFELGI